MEASRPFGDNATLYAHGGFSADPTTGAILTPIYQSTAFVQESVEKYLAKGYSYSRSGNPTVRSLEKKINAVEGGADAACFSTGMAATLAVGNKQMNNLINTFTYSLFIIINYYLTGIIYSLLFLY